MSRHILVTDIGSTTTKALLLEKNADGFTMVETADEPTTVESPHEDVRVGLFRAVDRLGESTGLPLRDGDRFTVPYYTTSSAGGGLQILVIALASWDTGVMARAVTCGAGGVVLDAFTIDDETPRVEKIRRMSTLTPDLVVMAGGYEGGAVAGVINMAHLLALSAPKPKYGSGRLPVVYCGNTGARDFVRESLGDGFDVMFTDNIRPSGTGFNLHPAISMVHGLFMDHVMQMAPGYRKVAGAVSAPVLPTPSGVERILALYAGSVDENLILADMGGATTDVFSSVNGALQRTVSANTGMSYSLSNTLREAGVPMVMRHLEGADQGMVRDRILDKTLFPTRSPSDRFGALVEHACAAEGMRLALGQHMSFFYRRKRVGFLDRLKALGSCKFDQTFKTLDMNTSFKSSDFQRLIGAGGVLAAAGDRRAAWILAQGFQPRGVTSLMVDTRFHSPHMGVLSTVYPGMALDYFTDSCLRTVCRVVTPMKAVRKGHPGIRVNGPDGEVAVPGGGFLFLEDGKGCRAGEWEETERVPLLVDCRTDPSMTLPVDFRRTPIEIRMVPPGHGRPTVIRGPVLASRCFGLPYPGEIHVSEGDRVEPGTLLGRNRLSPPMVYFVDVRSALGYDPDCPSDEILAGITVSPGDEVLPGTEVFRRKGSGSLLQAVHTVKSPVRGVVTGVSAPGLIRLREIQDYDGRPHSVDVAGPLGIRPKHMGRHMEVRRGDFVLRGQALAVGKNLVTVKSPSAGTVTEVDRGTGRVTVQYITSPVDLISPVHATVTKVARGHSVDLTFEGVFIEGVLGVGKDVHGRICLTPEKDGLQLVEGPVTGEHLLISQSSGTRGIIAPSISGELLAFWLGGEPGVILTGNEDLPVSLLVIRGVGSTPFNRESWRDLAVHAGSHGALFTTTRIRAGVERPWLLVEKT